MQDILSKIPMVYEPLRNNRFVIKFPSELGLLAFEVVSSGMPTITQGTTELAFMNTSTWVLGRYTWDDLDITFRNLVGVSSAQAVMEWIRLGSESVTGRQGYAAGYKKNITIELLDPTGVTVQKWLLINAFLFKASFGSLKYDDDAVNEISCSVKYDYAVLVF